jgi:two-component system, LytTR family, response regulator
MQKVIIIDDEPAGRLLLRQYIGHFPDLVLMGEANNGVDGLKLCNEFKPDLIFLDVQMPGMNGFQMLSHLQEIPKIIFSTAYDKYAVQAFEINAIDYLLKPYTLERFKAALVKNNQSPSLENIKNLSEGLDTSQKYTDRVYVSYKQKLLSILVSDIIKIQADGDYSRIHTAQGVYLSTSGISQLEIKMNPKLFIRVHRSCIINADMIQEIQKENYQFEIILKNQDKVKVSRGFSEKIKAGII